MMFYNGFNLMIDIILVSITAYFYRRIGRLDFATDISNELAYEYNEGWEAGYETAILDKERNTMFLNYDNHGMKESR